MREASLVHHANPGRYHKGWLPIEAGCSVFNAVDLLGHQLPGECGPKKVTIIS